MSSERNERAILTAVKETTRDMGYDVKPLQEDMITKFVSARAYN